MPDPPFKPGEVVGVTFLEDLTDLKRTLLLFDRVAICPLPEWDKLIRAADPGYVEDLNWLEQEGVVFWPSPKFYKLGLGQSADGNISLPALTEWPGIKEENVFGAAQDRMMKSLTVTGDFRQLLISLNRILLRSMCAGLRTLDIEAVSLISLSHPSQNLIEQATCSSKVLDLTIRKLPVPDEMTSLERILEFRRDPSANASLLRLRQWMTKVRKENLNEIEIAQEMEHLLTEYDEHLRLHEIKTKRSQTETVVTFVAEAAEDLVKLKLGKLAQSLFAVGRRKVDLLEAEANAPGRSLSYVWKANKEFSPKD